MKSFQKLGQAIRRTSSKKHAVSFTWRGQTICRNKLFEHTNGRFLANEDDAFKQRYLHFDIDELCAIASRVGSASPVHTVEKMEGGFSRALAMKKLDGTTVVAKLPFKIAGRQKYTTAAEVAVLQYVHQHTEVPVPRVLAWSCDSSNPVRAEYIIMEKAAGTQLVKKWHEMKDQSHFILIKNLCALEAELASIRFPANGSLYLRESMSDGDAYTSLGSDIDPFAQFCVGPSCDKAWNTQGSQYTDSGPWPDLPSFGQALVQREISRMTNSAEITSDTRFPRGGAIVDQIQLLKQTEKVMQCMDSKTLPGKFARPALWHTDLHFGNIYVSDQDPTNIVSLIDWQGAVIAPLFYQVRFPEFIELGEDYVVGGPVPRLPNDLAQMDKDDQDLARFEHKQACMAKAYEAASGFKDKEIFWALQLSSSFRELFVRCGAAYEEGVVPVRACLIELLEGWKEAGFLEQCPITFSNDDIAQHEREFQEYSAFHSIQQIARKYLDTDAEGWIPPSADFEQKQEQNQELLQLVLDNSAKYNKTSEEVKRIWPF